MSISTREVYMATCLFSPSSLGGKSEGRQVNIDAHSVPSQPQSIWIHSSLWRANNLEETLIAPPLPLPPPIPDLLAARCLSPLSLSSCPLLLCPRASLSFYRRLHFPSRYSLATLPDTLCSHFMYVFPVTADEL